MAEAPPSSGEAVYRSIFNLTPSGVVLIEPSGRIRTFNDLAHRQLGYTRLEFSRLSVSDIDVEETHAQEVRAHLARIASSAGEEFETRHRTRTGELRDVRVRSQPVKVGGEPFFLAVWTDITERKRAEATAREREIRLQAYFESPAVGIAITSLTKGWEEVNDRACAMLGYSREELAGKTWLELTHPDDVEADVREFERLLAGETDRYALDKRFIRKDGTVLWTELSVSSVRRPDGRPESFVAILTDIGVRKRAEAALRASEARFRGLSNDLPVGVYETDPAGRVVFVNRKWSEMTGLSLAEATRPEAGEVIHPDDRDRVSGQWDQTVATGGVFSGEYRLRTVEGRQSWVRAFGTALRDDAGAVTGHVGALADITEPRALQAQLAVTSRLAAMGTLVTGLAHEVNNPLTGILGGQGMAVEDLRAIRQMVLGEGPLPKEAILRSIDDALAGLEDAQVSSQRVAAIVKDLSLFGRPDSPRARTRLVDVVHGAVRWLPATVAGSATLVIEDAGPPEVTASPGQMEQVVVNLVTNAAHAIPAGRPGVIKIRVGPGAPGWSRLEVSDDGTGIEPQVLERMFDPFFTTRPTGKGMGLGLAISHAIATAHGGTITATSTPGEGSTFRVELPAAE
jgi:PAS domain S-box-containing protein